MPDAALEIHVLDMGRERYGDCLLVKSGATTLLVDGGHKSDFEGQDGSVSIPDQLRELLGAPPFQVTALIVTHCHSDHIGCLPEMVEEGLLRPEWALVADEKLGFGRAVDDDALAIDRLSPDAAAVVAALREEDRSTMTDAELRQFLVDAASVEPRYKAMLRTLKDQDTKIVRYGRDDVTPFVQQLSAMKFEVLGPTREHLAICAEAIARLTTDAAEAVTQSLTTDVSASPVDLYRSLTAAAAPVDALDRPGKGAAINNQSVVFKVSSGGKSALLGGDMQFAKAEIRGLDRHMARLREVVTENGPYVFAKLTHHTSDNAVDDSVLEDLGNPAFLAHTGGWNDPGHPDTDALETLKRHRRAIKLARTDRNGGISFTFSGGFEISKGRLNDFTPNSGDDVLAPPKPGGGETVPVTPAPPPPPVTAESQGAASVRPMIDLLFMRLPVENLRITVGDIPIAIEVAPAAAPPSPPPFAPPPPDPGPQRVGGRLAGGRTLPSLLFVTASPQLARNVGEAEAARAVRLIRDSGQELLDIKTADDAKQGLRRRLAKGDVKGVVVVGGYDVLPSERVDVLDPPLRQRIGAEVRDEPDAFVVWSDDRYGDVDGDGIAEFPVSRIPDGYSAALLTRCLTAGPPMQAGRFGIRNQERPFADAIWNVIAGAETILRCGPSDHSQLNANDIRRPAVYFMLHGDDVDGTRFWGEDGGSVEAINVANLPKSDIGTVFSGCCWGALTVSQIASKAGNALGIRTPGQSLALSLLMGGATAFVGCTGAHYSPDAGADFFGGPLHHSFWSEFIGGRRPPAEALFQARTAYLKGMPHGLSKPYHLGIERKIYKQFTCLGLGW